MPFAISAIFMNILNIKSLKEKLASISLKLSNPNAPAIHPMADFNRSSGIPTTPPTRPPIAPRIPPRKPSCLKPSIAPLTESMIDIIRVIGAKITRPTVLNRVKIGDINPRIAPKDFVNPLIKFLKVENADLIPPPIDLPLEANSLVIGSRAVLTPWKKLPIRLIPLDTVCPVLDNVLTNLFVPTTGLPSTPRPNTLKNPPRILRTRFMNDPKGFLPNAYKPLTNLLVPATGLPSTPKPTMRKNPPRIDLASADIALVIRPPVRLLKVLARAARYEARPRATPTARPLIAAVIVARKPKTPFSINPFAESTAEVNISPVGTFPFSLSASNLSPACCLRLLK